MSKSQSLLGPTRIHWLRLQNFRRFADLRLPFHPDLTVIVAENGGGKSALLKAIALSLDPLVYQLATNLPTRVSEADARRIPDPEGRMTTLAPCVVQGGGSISGKDVEWTLGIGASGDTSDLVLLASDLKSMLQQYAETGARPAPVLPLIRYFGPVAGLESFDKAESGNWSSRLSPYLNSLRPEILWKEFAGWFEAMSYEAQAEVAEGIPSPHTPRQLLESVNRVIRAVLEPSGWRSLGWDFVLRQVVANHPSAGRLAIGSLSDGIRRIVAIAADLAHRAARLNSHFGADASENTPGIVLIDEVDLHLHPRWQQLIVPALKSAFPLIQFIVTTHSDRVLSTVPAASIRVLDEEGQVHIPGTQTQGNSAEYILADIFGVDPIPPDPNAGRIAEYRRLIAEGQDESPAGEDLRRAIEQHFGPRHPVMMEADRLKRFQKLRLKRGDLN